MGNIKGTIISLKDFLFDEDTAIRLIINDEPKDIVHLKKGRKLSVPEYQREIRWQKENIFALMNDIAYKEKFLGNIILSRSDDAHFQIIDGQQRIVALTMLVNYIKNTYHEQINDIRDLVEVEINKFDRFNDFQTYEYNIKKVPEAVRSELIESDKLFQIERLTELYREIQESPILNNADKARRFLNNLRTCTANVIIADEEDVKISTEYYLDVNVKGIKLDREDIFKGYLFSQDSSDEIRSGWVKLKERWFQFNYTLDKIHSGGAYSLTKILEQYIYCDILQKKEYQDVNIDENFLLVSRCEVNGTQYYSGDHIIKVINNNTYMRKVIEGTIEYIELLTELIETDGGVPGKMKKLLNQIASNERKIICNIIKKGVVDKTLIVPKMLLLKYYISISDGKASKETCKQIYAIYFYIVFFMLFADKKKAPDTIKKIVRSSDYYSELNKAIKEITGREYLASNRLTAISRWNSNYQDETLKYKCKSLATVYNYFEVHTNKVKITSVDDVLSFMSDENQYSIEHLIINDSNSVKYIEEMDEYELPGDLKKYGTYIFNFIFIPKQINNSILKNYSIKKKLELLQKEENLRQIKCSYSLKIIKILESAFNCPEIKALGNREIDELEKYWLVQFKKEYTNYVQKVIDLIIDRFNGST